MSDATAAAAITAFSVGRPDRVEGVGVGEMAESEVGATAISFRGPSVTVDAGPYGVTGLVYSQGYVGTPMCAVTKYRGQGRP